MPGDVTFSAGLLYGFLLTLSRIAGLLVVVPLPGLRATPEPVRIVLALALTLCLGPAWPRVEEPASVLNVAGMAVLQALAGFGAGLATALLLDGFQLAAQMLGLQAGYSYASTIDPTNQTDSGILQVFAQLLAASAFFAVGLDRYLFKALAAGLAAPLAPHNGLAIDAVSQLGSAMFNTAVRLAMPLVSLMLLLDVALAMVGRMQAQLQLLSLAFPLKMLAALVILSVLAAAYPSVLQRAAELTFRLLPALGGA